MVPPSTVDDGQSIKERRSPPTPAMGLVDRWTKSVAHGLTRRHLLTRLLGAMALGALLDRALGMPAAFAQGHYCSSPSCNCCYGPCGCTSCNGLCSSPNLLHTWFPNEQCCIESSCRTSHRIRVMVCNDGYKSYGCPSCG